MALKRHFRRSSILDRNKPTIENDSLNLIESSSASSYSTACSNLQPQQMPPEKSIIVISDSESEKEIYSKPRKASLPKSKIGEIEDWLTKVNSEIETSQINNIKDVSTLFNEISAICEDGKKTDHKPIAVNSTFLDIGKKKRFDELFNTVKKLTKIIQSITQTIMQIVRKS